MKPTRPTKDEKKNDSFGATLKGTQLDGYYNRQSQSNSTTSTLIGLTRLGAAISPQSARLSSVTQANSFDQQTLRGAVDLFEKNHDRDRYTQYKRGMFWNSDIGNPFLRMNPKEIDHHEDKEKATSPKNNKF